MLTTTPFPWVEKIFNLKVQGIRPFLILVVPGIILKQIKLSES
jgi:hypothetical protein